MTEPETRESGPRYTQGAPCWTSLLVRELADAQEFYRELFGWEFHAGPQQIGPYVRALVSGYEVAGLGEMGGGRWLRSAWLPYMASDDADATADLVRECGGTVAVGPLDAEEAGRMVIAADSVGGCFGVWQSERLVGVGPGAAGTPGTPVWYELLVRDTAAPGVFYPRVFGYETKSPGGAVSSAVYGNAAAGDGPSGDSPSGDSAAPDEADEMTLYVDGRPIGGIHGVRQALPRDLGPHWLTYFAVADTDASTRRVRELGGSVLREPADSPYGRMAMIADREGARLCLVTAGA